MPADLMTPESIVYNRVNGIPWHKCGISFGPEDEMTCLRAMEIAKTDYTVHKVRNAYVIPSDPPQTKIADSFTLLREPIPSDPEWREFGPSTERYVVLQNREVAALIDSLGILGGVSGWHLDTHGALGRGERVFFAIEAGKFSVLGEECRQYVTVLDSKDGGSAFKLTISGVRVVCANTWASNEAAARITANIPHTGQIKDEVALRMSLIKQIQEAGTSLKEACEKIATIKVTDDQVDTVSRALFPDPKRTRKFDLATDLTADQLGGMAMRAIFGDSDDPKKDQADQFEAALATAQARRAGIVSHYQQINADFSPIAGTGWALFNGVTGYIDHDLPRISAESKSFPGQGSVAQVKTRAFSEILALN